MCECKKWWGNGPVALLNFRYDHAHDCPLAHLRMNIGAILRVQVKPFPHGALTLGFTATLGSLAGGGSPMSPVDFKK